MRKGTVTGEREATGAGGLETDLPRSGKSASSIWYTVFCHGKNVYEPVDGRADGGPTRMSG